MMSSSRLAAILIFTSFGAASCKQDEYRTHAEFVAAMDSARDAEHEIEAAQFRALPQAARDSIARVDKEANPMDYLEVDELREEGPNGSMGTNVDLTLVLVNNGVRTARNVTIEAVQTTLYSSTKKMMRDTVVTVVHGPIGPGDTLTIKQENGFHRLEGREKDLGILTSIKSAVFE